MTAENAIACSQCHSKKFDIVEQLKDIRIISEDSEQTKTRGDGTQSSSGEF